ncbi:hypothetical protein MKX08_009822 [Trichoderma sp. CBMAI-0020]|nr:hypothetical protein MKX08_009822 [Trichoderma sp. CBMAI-0020]
MDGDRTISQNTLEHDALIIQGDVTTTVKGGVSVTNNYGTSPANTDKRDGEDGILRRLYTSPYEDRKDRNPSRVPGTCDWFMSHELFQSWEESKSSRLLWVSADPGCGKSVLVKHLVDSILQTTESRTVCYFFFKDDFPDQKNVVSALCCILRQLFIKKPLLLSDEILRQFATGGETFFNSFTELWKTLIQISKDQSAGEIICILDAIDECEDQGSQLARELCKLYGTANDFNLKFLLTSRPYGNIHRGFRPLEIPGLPVIHLSGESEDEIKKISHEIDIFIRFKVKDVGKRLKLLEEEQNRLLQGLMKVSHRTYLWVYLTLDLIERDIVIDKTISNAAYCMPETVDEAYDRILSRSCDFEQAKKILHIVVAAARPLSLEEMNLALALEKNHRSNNDIKLKPEERFRQELRDICGFFITIIDSKIYLLHQTAKEFLLQNNSNPPTEVFGPSVWKHSFNLFESHNILFCICILYLCSLESDINHHHGTQALCLRAEDMIFLDYSAKYWVTHYHGLHVQTQKEKTEVILKICDVDLKYSQIWFNAYWTSTNTELPKGFTTLMMTAYFGLETAVQSLIEIEVDLNSQDETYQRTALSWAVRNGFNVIAELLIRGIRVKQGPITLPWRKKAKVNQADIYGRTPLSYAVWNGNVAIVDLLVNAGALAHLKDELGGTPISYAYFSQNEQIIDILLRKKDQIDINNDFDHLLLSAAEKGHEEVVELLLKTKGHAAVIKVLLERGADPNCRDHINRTPLLYAAKQNDIAMVKALLERGADPNCRAAINPMTLVYDEVGSDMAMIKALLARETDPNCRDDDSNWTPLLYAVLKNNIAMAKALLDKGADPGCRDYLSLKPLLCAIKYGSMVMIEALLEKGADPNCKNDDHETPLLYVTKRGHLKAMEILLEKGADPNCIDNNYETPLLYAINRGHLKAVEILLEKGADPNCINNNHETPLLYATKRGHLKAVEVLLQKGADPNYTNHIHRIPLLYTAQVGNIKVVKAFLKGGADFKHKDKSGRAPLSYAAECGNLEVVKALLEEGADSAHKDKSGRIPLSYAAEHGNLEVVKAFLKGGADLKHKDKYSRTLLSYAAECGHFEVVKALLEGGADLKHEDKSGRAPLSYAVEYSDLEVVKVLLEGGADLNSEAKSGRTPLSYAAEFGNVAAIEILIDRGADPNQEDIYDRTPLIYAAKNGHLVAVMELLGKGANPNYKDIYHRAPLFYANENNYRAVEKLLLKVGGNYKVPFSHGKKNSHKRAGAGISSYSGLLRDYEAVTKVLLEGFEGTDLATLLLWAEEQSHEAVARLPSE